jgi:signal transduction histidine kinase
VIKWFLQREWLSVSIVGTAAVIVFAGIDFLFQGAVAIGPAVLIASSLFFSRRWPYIGTALVAAGTIWQLNSVAAPLVSGAASALSLLLVAAFANSFWRQVAVIATNILGILVVWQSTFGASPVLREFGISLTGENATWLTFLLGSTAVVSVNSLSWILGRFLITRDTYVGTPLDRAVITHTQAKLSLDVATAKERLSIVSDLADLLIQRISAVVSLAEGAKFASKSDPESAIRSLDRIESSAQSAQSELRKLYDLLQKGADLSAAPPNIEDLGQLMILMRELGYNATISVDGEPFAINEGAQLCIYRIAFEALENIKKNSAIGADVTVDFYWTAEGLQVLVKDNGIEAARRASVSTAQELASYTVDDDVEALVKPITGATLNALKERASLYEGNIEVTKVPGVGFTLSAMFPHLRAVAGD